MFPFCTERAEGKKNHAKLFNNFKQLFPNIFSYLIPVVLRFMYKIGVNQY